MPRYYKDKIYTEIERKKIAAHLTQVADKQDLAFYNSERTKGKTDKQIQHERLASHMQSFKNIYQTQKKRGL